jgi:hypothetical protein
MSASVVKVITVGIFSGRGSQNALSDDRVDPDAGCG